MPRLLRDGDWYELLSPGGVYESEFQAMVVARAANLFPDYVVSRFDCLIESERGTAKADLALIDKQYRFWWVVEIELATHSLDGHVLLQVARLAQGAYGEDQAQYLATQSTGLNLAKLTQMMKGVQPRVLVVVNSPRPDWSLALAPWDAQVAVVEVYRSDTNKVILRLNGAYPDLPHDFVSRCRLDSMMPKFLVVESPANLPQTEGGRVTIRVQGGQTTWLRLETKDRVWLVPDGPLALDPKRVYLLRRGEEGALDLVEEA